MSSPFLDVPESSWVASNTLSFAIRDKYPVSPGHTLVIPRRLVASWFEATPEEQRALFELVDVVKRGLDGTDPKPDGYNLGINVGGAAGQTVPHLHVHVIPRHQGDMADPRGGVRHVIPSKGNYLRTPAKPLATGGVKDPFLWHLEPLFAQATDVSVLAAFVQESGLAVLYALVQDALSRGARVRLLTGDYMSITGASALRQLLDWMNANQAQREEGAGVFEARIVEVKDIGRAFHPKSWRFEGPELAVAFVGSSNVSHSALKTGVEWNLPVERDQNPRAYQDAVDAFEAWWLRARRFDAAWITRYEREAAQSRPPRQSPPPEAEGLVEEPVPVPRTREPHGIQREALAALESSRQSGRRRALVIMATGLGKTLVAAIDIAKVEAALGRRARVLFLVHRSELLMQAATTLRSYLPHSEFGWFVGARRELDADVLFASVQKLSRPENLAWLSGVPPFDYVVIDEVHHASAPGYRGILACLRTTFLLGLTATPERTDAGDIFGLFEDNVVYRADLAEGISRELLVPFAYHGLKDDVAYENIPWRNRRFDPAKLAAAVQTEARMRKMWEAWEQHPATRTLVFCASVPHAEYVRDWLRQKGVRTVAVHSGAESDDRAEALSSLVNGGLDAICAVDIFNEGIDLPTVDRVVMLRPTESPVVFMQQLGRGLRKADKKTSVTIIDFVGNHRMFLDRVQTLLSLGMGPSTPLLQDFLVHDKEPTLPPGCSVQVELEAKRLLAKMVPKGSSEVARMYRELRHAWGRRPTMGELYRLGYLPSALKQGWFQFVGSQGDLTSAEAKALENRGKDWFEALESTPMSKSFKMVVLQVLLDAHALEGGMPLAELASSSLLLLRQRPELGKDLEGVKALDDQVLFRVDGERLVPLLPIGVETRDAFHAMTQELVDYRLARFVGQGHANTHPDGFDAKVIHNSSDMPILMLPSRSGRPGIPDSKKEGPVIVTLPDGSRWKFLFVKIAVNKAWPAGLARETNRLPELLRQWFGPKAGASGTAFQVRFTQDTSGWHLEPLGASITPLLSRRALVAFPSLKAAAGAANDSLAGAPEEGRVQLPLTSSSDDLFAVRASGDSMMGGERPIRDGDWLVMRYVRGMGVGALSGHVALLQVPDTSGHAYQVKRIVRHGTHWLLRSENPEHPSIEVTEEVKPIAQLVEVIPPERLGPFAGVLLDDEGVMSAFGLPSAPKTGRYHGHLFLCVDQPGRLKTPDRLEPIISVRNPAETAFVLTRMEPGGSWRYAGVARWNESEGAWVLPEPVDSDTWKALGAPFDVR
ncbi:Helicase-related protein [Cystobacter fuscus DSM 2262]|uniref:Helicase-related protein n=1 Tax=Cystobacter fuscus (strain ATCC 25194 / DSM 2262 / NBRC 100088 / M29) TaxID=1242864 RepID=S9NYC5_CYSF2|nr:DEAD/DEAH box helicase family protein [Cystobacter fuscus]EPX57210.1 Helicase-related protein [Cystobacter fuscus DSM 2262]